jgi:oligopeptide/dipeptide ABC transporter ATP-binding protein
LLASIPKLGTKEPLYAVPGQPPDLANLPSGCAFHPRCAHTMERCRIEDPREEPNDDGGTTRCWLAATRESAHA